MMEDLCIAALMWDALRGNSWEGFMFGGGGVTEGTLFMQAPDTIRRFGDLNRLPGKDRQEIF